MKDLSVYCCPASLLALRAAAAVDGRGEGQRVSHAQAGDIITL